MLNWLLPGIQFIPNFAFNCIGKSDFLIPTEQKSQRICPNHRGVAPPFQEYQGLFVKNTTRKSKDASFLTNAKTKWVETKKER
jgi:hypothetical protein